MTFTARALLQKIATDSGISYRDIAQRVNDEMTEGKGLQDSIRAIVQEQGLDPDTYRLSATKIVAEAKRILREDYTQTLMISAVLGQMVEGPEKDRFPVPAFLAFLEVLAFVDDARRDTKSETSQDIDEHATRMIELMTTLVSVVCKWSKDGVVGVADDCPTSLQELAMTVFRKIKLLQSGLWTCISCGNIVSAKETNSLMCLECNAKIDESEPVRPKRRGRERARTGYGQADLGDEIE